VLQLHVEHQSYLVQVDPLQDFQKTIHLLQGWLSGIKHMVGQHAGTDSLSPLEKGLEHRIAIPPRDAGPNRDEIHRGVVGGNLIKIWRLSQIRAGVIARQVNPKGKLLITHKITH